VIVIGVLEELRRHADSGRPERALRSENASERPIDASEIDQRPREHLSEVHRGRAPTGYRSSSLIST
jgi:hypothetical protein